MLTVQNDNNYNNGNDNNHIRDNDNDTDGDTDDGDDANDSHDDFYHNMMMNWNAFVVVYLNDAYFLYLELLFKCCQLCYQASCNA